MASRAPRSPSVVKRLSGRTESARILGDDGSDRDEACDVNWSPPPGSGRRFRRRRRSTAASGDLTASAAWWPRLQLKPTDRARVRRCDAGEQDAAEIGEPLNW